MEFEFRWKTLFWVEGKKLLDVHRRMTSIGVKHQQVWRKLSRHSTTTPQRRMENSTRLENSLRSETNITENFNVDV